LPVAKQWHLLPHDSFAIQRLASSLRISPVIAQLLLNRGLAEPNEAKRFLESPLKGLHPPAALPGVPLAVERLSEAIAQGRRICIYGDYDVDGTTGTAILLRLLETLKAPAQFYVPNRLEEGYGLNGSALRELAASGVQVVVTVDCGIASIREAELAKQLGIELIITDHHEFKDKLPDASVLVHPRLPGTSYPFGGLSGSAVAFKLAWAMAIKASGSDRVTPVLREFLLEAVALATLGVVADVVPLQDENRILVRHGLARMTDKPSVGLKALIEMCKIEDGKEIRSEDIGFKLGPRLNAAGRLGSARQVVEMLTTRDPGRAQEIAESLQKQNEARQKLEREMIELARQMVEDQNLALSPALVLASNIWHPGVMGIVAGRLVESFARPVLMIATRDGGHSAPGSGRSIAGFALHEALKACDAELLGHGGHAAAAGFRVNPERIDAFRTLFCAYAAGHFPTGVPPAPVLELDAEVPLIAVTPGLLRDLDQLEPYGASNRRPRFLTGGLELVGDPRRIGKDRQHLSFKVKQDDKSLRAVAWHMGDRMDELMSGNGYCCLAFTPKFNTWNGYTNIDLEVSDFQAGEDAVLS